MGISRSSTCIVAYFIKYLKWNVDKSIKFLQSKREFVNPNPGFVCQLEKYEKVFY